MLDDLPIVHISRDGITIGAVQLPAELILHDGITIKPGGGIDVNRMTVTFIVGHIRVDDPTTERVNE